MNRLLFVSFGLIGELLVRIWHESQGKPIYAVEERRPARAEPGTPPASR